MQCPQCTSQKVWKDGLRKTRHGETQRWLCRSCGYRFSDPKIKVHVTSQTTKPSNSMPNLTDRIVISRNLTSKKTLNDLAFSVGKDVGSHELTTVGKRLNTFPSYNSKRQVCVTETQGAKNLARQKPRLEKAGAGATPTQQEVLGKIVNYSFWMLKQGYAQTTIEVRTRFMKTLMKRGANLFDPESVKEVIAKQKTWSDNTKSEVVNAYHNFAILNNLTWQPPIYRKTESLPFIPLETEIDQLIAGCGKKVAAYLQTLKETAMRPGEAWRLKWIDIDNERRLVRLNKPEKNSNPRMWKVSDKLITMLNRLPKKSEYVFATKCQRGFKQNFRAQRKSIARKLANPRILQVTMYTLRHWKATMLYHQMKDILYVMKFLGHKNIKNTLLYVTMESTIFGLTDSDEFTVKVAETLKEACELLEAGFEYVTDMDGKKIFRKRK